MNIFCHIPQFEYINTNQPSHSTIISKNSALFLSALTNSSPFAHTFFKLPTKISNIYVGHEKTGNYIATYNGRKTEYIDYDIFIKSIKTPTEKDRFVSQMETHIEHGTDLLKKTFNIDIDKHIVVRTTDEIPRLIPPLTNKKIYE